MTKMTETQAREYQTTEYGRVISEHDAEKIARIIMGTWGGFGMNLEYPGLSGMRNKIQKHITRISAGWKLYEEQNGDGSSTYWVKWNN